MKFISRIKLTLLLLGHALAQLLPRRPTGVSFSNIGEGTVSTGVKSFLPDATTSVRYALYKVGVTADSVAICGAGDRPLGQSDDMADSTTTPIAINLFGVKPGTLLCINDGTVVNNSRVKAGASGKVTLASSTDLSFGTAIVGTDRTTADGDLVEIIHCLPYLYVF